MRSPLSEVLFTDYVDEIMTKIVCELLNGKVSNDTISVNIFLDNTSTTKNKMRNFSGQ